MKDIELETNFKDAFMRVTQFLGEANLPLSIVYDNKKPNNLPESISKDWDIVQKFYKQEEEAEKETGDIILT